MKWNERRKGGTEDGNQSSACSFGGRSKNDIRNVPADLREQKAGMNFMNGEFEDIEENIQAVPKHKNRRDGFISNMWS